MNLSFILFTSLVHLPFAINGYQQIVGDWRSRFRRWNMPNWFPFVLVPVQLVLNVLLWFPNYRFLAAIGLGTILLGAIMTLTRYYEKRQAYLLPLGGFLALILWGVFGTV